MDQENVKERLNTLLHKKLSKNEKKNKETENLNAPQEELNEAIEKKQIPDKTDGHISNTESEKCNAATTGISPSPDYLCTHYLLHEILSEKKKALLQNKEVIQFLKNKANFDGYLVFFFLGFPHTDFSLGISIKLKINVRTTFVIAKTRFVLWHP